MKTEEIIEVLQAYEEGKELEFFYKDKWIIYAENGLEPLLIGLGEGVKIRVKPEIKIEKVVLYTNFPDSGRLIDKVTASKHGCDTHRITYNLVDGEPYLESFKIEKL